MNESPQDPSQPPFCITCGGSLRFNVPRLGTCGGYVHTSGAGLECDPVGKARVKLIVEAALAKRSEEATEIAPASTPAADGASAACNAAKDAAAYCLRSEHVQLGSMEVRIQQAIDAETATRDARIAFLESLVKLTASQLEASAEDCIKERGNVEQLEKNCCQIFDAGIATENRLKTDLQSAQAEIRQFTEGFHRDQAEMGQLKAEIVALREAMLRIESLNPKIGSKGDYREGQLAALDASADIAHEVRVRASASYTGKTVIGVEELAHLRNYKVEASEQILQLEAELVVLRQAMQKARLALAMVPAIDLGARWDSALFYRTYVSPAVAAIDAAIDAQKEGKL